MIYTVTFNPSLDYIVNVDDFKLGKVNRTKEETLYPGGKGINVSIVLNNLGYETTALGFLAGFTGEKIQSLLEEKNIKTDFITVDSGFSRINVKLHSKEESEINGRGPIIQSKDIEKLYEKLNLLTSEDILVLAGSIPESMPDSMYMDLMKYLNNKNIKIIVDATKDLLLNVLNYHPFLVKPNHHELAEIFKVDITTKEEVVFYAKKLQDMGAKNVLVSMAKDGAVLVDEMGEVHYEKAPTGVVKNSVGSGDSMVAGFIAGYLEYQNYDKALKLGICSGSASAFSEELATKQEIDNLFNNFL